MISLLERGWLSAFLSSCIQRLWLFPSSIDTQSTPPLQCDTDNDADPFAESRDEKEMEDNETVLEYC